MKKRLVTYLSYTANQLGALIDEMGDRDNKCYHRSLDRLDNPRHYKVHTHRSQVEQ